MRVGAKLLELCVGDITELDVDAIVNPANERLVLGGGVAGAIRRKGGPRVEEECRRIGYCPVGSAVITSGGSLKARYVIHAVGPRWGEEGVEEKLRSATLSSLRLADQYGLRSLALPAISTGAFGVPLEVCASVMIPTVIDYLKRQGKLEHVYICLFRDEAYRVFVDVLREHAKGQGLSTEG